MAYDIDSYLRDWEFKPGIPQARLTEARDGRQILQMRIDLGLLQLEIEGRPDGVRPHNCTTYLDYLKQHARKARKKEKSFTMSEEQCVEADREFVQYYYRRLCWMTLQEFGRLIADADHTLRFMDFVKEHSPSEEYTSAHEQYRAFVLFHRTQAAAAQEVANGHPDAAIDRIHEGLERMRSFFEENDASDQFDDDMMVMQLHRMEQTLRSTHKIEITLEEQLRQAVANEEYEAAAQLRDEIRRRSKSGPT